MEKSKKRRIRPKTGEFFAVPLEDGEFAYGRVLTTTRNAFYNLKSSELLPIEQIAVAPVLFTVSVDSTPIRDQIWPIIGRAPLEEHLLKPQTFFVWDLIAERLFITQDWHVQTPATVEECEGLERATLWNQDFIERRLRDTLAGRGDQWVDSPGPPARRPFQLRG
jgi:hypothetical protein